MTRAKLYAIPGSHPSMTARLMLERKGIPYKRVDLMPVVSKGVLRLQGFRGITVPALKIEGERVQGSREIGRHLDRLKREPQLYPGDEALRSKVEQAEAWGDSEFQEKPRRLVWWALRRNRAPLATYSQGARLGIPIGLAVRMAQPIVALSAKFNGATDEAARADLASLPADLDRIDAWIAEGVLGGERLNAADLQIAPSVRLLMTLEDLRPAIESRPVGELAMRAVPDFPGRTPPIFPAEWLAGFRS